MGSDTREFLNQLRTIFSFRGAPSRLEYLLCNYISGSGFQMQVKTHHLTIVNPEGMEIPRCPGGSTLKRWLPGGSNLTTGWTPGHSSILLILNKFSKTIGKIYALKNNSL